MTNAVEQHSSHLGWNQDTIYMTYFYFIYTQNDFHKTQCWSFSFYIWFSRIYSREHHLQTLKCFSSISSCAKPPNPHTDPMNRSSTSVTILAEATMGLSGSLKVLLLCSMYLTSHIRAEIRLGEATEQLVSASLPSQPNRHPPREVEPDIYWIQPGLQVQLQYYNIQLIGNQMSVTWSFPIIFLNKGGLKQVSNPEYHQPCLCG